MKKQIFALTLCALALSACQNNASTTVNANKTASANTATPSPSVAATTPSTGIKTAEGTGVVTKIDMNLGSVELNHDEIKGMMPAMLMEFYVADKKELEPLKVGDKVTFTLEDNKGAERITKISKIK